MKNSLVTPSITSSQPPFQVDLAFFPLHKLPRSILKPDTSSSSGRCGGMKWRLEFESSKSQRASKLNLGVVHDIFALQHSTSMEIAGICLSALIVSRMCHVARIDCHQPFFSFAHQNKSQSKHDQISLLAMVKDEFRRSSFRFFRKLVSHFFRRSSKSPAGSPGATALELSSDESDRHNTDPDCSTVLATPNHVLKG